MAFDFQSDIIFSDPNSRIFELYQNVEQRCRKYTKNLAIYMILHQFPVISAFLNSLISISIGNLDASTWKIPVPMAVPFDVNIMRNWYLVLFFHLNGGTVYIYVMTLISSSFISFCLYICAICDHFDLLIQSLQTNIERNQVEKNRENVQKRKQFIEETICETVRIQIKALE